MKLSRVKPRVSPFVGGLSDEFRHAHATTFATRSSRVSPRATLLLVLTLVVLASSTLLAQTGTARLAGRVTDPQGKVVPDAIVEAFNNDTDIRTVTRTDGEGLYYLTSLPPGNYRVVVTKEGFRQIIQANLGLHTQDELTLNFALQVGSASETITVAGTAGMVPISDSPAVGLLVDRTFVENTPLNGRSLQDLIALAPGAVTSNDNALPGGLFTINGQRTDSNYYSVDGVASNVNSLPGSAPAQQAAGAVPAQTALGTTQSLASLDALQEFKIQTAGYSAEYGRQPGGQVELRTRSGGDEIHGSLFDYFRNEAFDANDWFANSAGVPRQAERQNDFGGTVGGPLVVPSIYNGRHKTFYFVSYEGLRLKIPTFSGILDVPTVAYRQFAANTVAPFLNSLPLPNGPSNNDSCAISVGYSFSCTAKWGTGYSNPSSLDSFSIKLDQNVGQHLQIFARYFDNPSYLSSRTSGSELDKQSNNSFGWTVGGTYRINSHLTQEARFNYTQNGGNASSMPIAVDGAAPYPLDLVVPKQYSAGTAVFGELAIGAATQAFFFNIPQYSGFVNKARQYNLVNNVAWIHGTHAFKVGGDYRRLNFLFNPPTYVSLYGIFSIQNIQAGIADLLAVTATQKALPTFNNVSLYAQDQWHATRLLTLNYGLRWEFNPPPGASDGLYPLALTTSNLATTQLAPRGTAQYGSTYRNFAPRLGVAYQAASWRNNPLVVRASFGMFYDTGQQLGALGYGGGEPGATYPFSTQNVFTNVSLPVAAPLLAPPTLNFPLVPPYGNLSGLNDPKLKLPYTEQWSLSLDQALGPKDMLTVSYVGNEGKRLLYSQYFPNAGAINSAFTSLQLVTNGGESRYHGLQVQNQGFVAPRLQVVASYAWAHAIDNVSTDYSNYPPLLGNSNYDLRQVLNVAAHYETREAGGYIARALTRGWSTDFRFSAQTGYPIDVYQGVYVLPNGSIGYIRPNLKPGAPLYLHNAPGALGGWALNAAAFALVSTDPQTGAPLGVGSLARNYIHGPNFWNLNTSVQKRVSLREGWELLFRVDAFNIFNHPNAGNIADCLCQSTFGLSGSSQTLGVPNQLYANGGPRSLQLMLRLQF